MSKTRQKPAERRRSFNARVYEIVRIIPTGKIMTYGAIGRLIPPPRGVDGGSYEKVRARWVGYALADCPDDIPWHRVINAAGRVSPRPGYDGMRQRILLEQEGVIFDEHGRVNLQDYLWTPLASWLTRHGLRPARG